MLRLLPVALLSFSLALVNARPDVPHLRKGNVAQDDVPTVTVTHTAVSTVTVCGASCYTSCTPSTTTVFVTSSRLPLSGTESGTGISTATSLTAPLSSAISTGSAITTAKGANGTCTLAHGTASTSWGVTAHPSASVSASISSLSALYPNSTTSAGASIPTLTGTGPAHSATTATDAIGFNSTAGTSSIVSSTSSGASTWAYPSYSSGLSWNTTAVLPTGFATGTGSWGTAPTATGSGTSTQASSSTSAVEATSQTTGFTTTISSTSSSGGSSGTGVATSQSLPAQPDILDHFFPALQCYIYPLELISSHWVLNQVQDMESPLQLVRQHHLHRSYRLDNTALQHPVRDRNSPPTQRDRIVVSLILLGHPDNSRRTNRHQQHRTIHHRDRRGLNSPCHADNDTGDIHHAPGLLKHHVYSTTRQHHLRQQPRGFFRHRGVVHNILPGLLGGPFIINLIDHRTRRQWTTTAPHSSSVFTTGATDALTGIVPTANSTSSVTGSVHPTTFVTGVRPSPVVAISSETSIVETATATATAVPTDGWGYGPGGGDGGYLYGGDRKI
ncbi:hypothetical protein QBC47DRAFT_431712 [Echria macrotheca]|uniref:Uncharacterized protein n=1 Tax=Echria macrotheca TaxID=438768 RepID=A0AAJ0BA73_9PEZI|nr:hypothetical protein QBC47DRAFT_431712 [Echria macrotheca]